MNEQPDQHSGLFSPGIGQRVAAAATSCCGQKTRCLVTENAMSCLMASPSPLRQVLYSLTLRCSSLWRLATVLLVNPGQSRADLSVLLADMSSTG